MSFFDEMDPTIALETIRIELLKNGQMDNFADLIAVNQHANTVSLHDFAEALEDCNIQIRLNLLRRIFKRLHTIEEDPDMINQYILMAAVTTGTISTRRRDEVLQSQRSFAGLENRIRKTIPPKPHIQTNDNLSPVMTLEQISFQVIGSGKYDELEGMLAALDTYNSGLVSVQAFADALEDISIFVRTVVVKRIFEHFSGKNVGGMLVMNRKELLNIIVEFAKKFDHADANRPGDYRTHSISKIADQLKNKNVLLDFEANLKIVDSRNTGNISVQDFADVLEDCDIHTHTQILREIFTELFGSIPDADGILSVKRDTLLHTMKVYWETKTWSDLIPKNQVRDSNIKNPSNNSIDNDLNEISSALYRNFL